MPQTRQAKKALRKSIKKGEKNKVVRETIKTMLKKSRQSIEAKKGESEKLVKDTIKKIDKATQKGVIKKNTAARRKSRLMKKLNASTKKA
jgi:small subunit ribosomal protein S20